MVNIEIPLKKNRPDGKGGLPTTPHVIIKAEKTPDDFLNKLNGLYDHNLEKWLEGFKESLKGKTNDELKEIKTKIKNKLLEFHPDRNNGDRTGEPKLGILIQAQKYIEEKMKGEEQENIQKFVPFLLGRYNSLPQKIKGINELNKFSENKIKNISSEEDCNKVGGFIEFFFKSDYDVHIRSAFAEKLVEHNKLDEFFNLPEKERYKVIELFDFLDSDTILKPFLAHHRINTETIFTNDKYFGKMTKESLIELLNEKFDPNKTIGKKR